MPLDKIEKELRLLNEKLDAIIAVANKLWPQLIPKVKDKK